MSQEVEEYSDELKREQDDELRQSIGKTQVAFMNIDGMSGPVQALVVLAILCAFGGILYFFYNELVVYKPDINEIRKEEIRMRKEKRNKQS